MMKRFGGGLTAVAVGLASAAASTHAWGQDRDVAAAERGAEIAARWCADCHATGAGRSAADVGPVFADIARTRSADYLRGFLANPHLRGLMPPFEMSTRQIEDVVAYLQTLQ